MLVRDVRTQAPRPDLPPTVLGQLLRAKPGRVLPPTVLGQLLGPCRARCWATPSGHDQTLPKMSLLTVFYKIECSLHEKETF